MIHINVNGKASEAEAETSIASLLSGLNIKQKHFVVEHNGEIIEHNRLADIRLHENDSIEIISFVGGG